MVDRFEPGFRHPCELSFAAEEGTRARTGPERAFAVHRERAVGVVPDPAGPGRCQRRPQLLEMRFGHEHGELAQFCPAPADRHFAPRPEPVQDVREQAVGVGEGALLDGDRRTEFGLRHDDERPASWVCRLHRRDEKLVASLRQASDDGQVAKGVVHVRL